VSRGCFITGTDTGCGKTEVTLGLMSYLRQRGKSVMGMKPIASGAQVSAEGLRNSDALRLQKASTYQADYSILNPCCYEPAIAPHLAAQASGVEIHSASIVENYHYLSNLADWVLVEGVGGWRVPLGDQVSLVELVRQLDLPVVLVVGLKLGCLNHAILTAEAIQHDGMRLKGWIANQVDPHMEYPEDNIVTLRNWLSAPCLGEIPYQPGLKAEGLAAYLHDFA
jgi:dethiobiotin synthetase